MFLKHFLKGFQVFSLLFVIEHYTFLPFGREIFIMGYQIKALYVISTTHVIWWLIPDHGGINLSALQPIFLRSSFH